MKIYMYDWMTYDGTITEVDEEGQEYEVDKVLIVGYGLDEKNRTVNVKIRGFQPFIYIEFRKNNFKESYVPLVKKFFSDRSENVKVEYVQKRNLYYCDKEFKEGKYHNKLHPYIKVTFEALSDRYEYISDLKRLINNKGISIKGYLCVDKIDGLKETNYPVYHQFCVDKDIPLCGWIDVSKYEEQSNKKNRVANNISRISTTINNIKKDNAFSKIPKFVTFSFDIECYSSRKGFMPSTENPEDKIFQISVVVRTPTKEFQYLLCLGKCGELNASKGKEDEHELSRQFISTLHEAKIINCASEYELIEKFVNLIIEHKPNIITGYNILYFDIPYIIGRANLVHCESALRKITLSKDRPASSNYRDKEDQKQEEQKVKELKTELNKGKKMFNGPKGPYKRDDTLRLKDTDGIVFIDMLTVARKMYAALPNYKLETVANFVLGIGKDPLNHEDIFRGYEEGTPESLAVVGKYCLRDSWVTLRLFERCKTAISICEQAKITHTHIGDIYGRGQQVRVFNQVKEHCHKNNIVVNPPPKTDEKKKFKGAIVLDPIVGLYDNILSFDFASLYPSVIMSEGLDYTTYIYPETDITGKPKKYGQPIPKDIKTFTWIEHNEECKCPIENNECKCQKEGSTECKYPLEGEDKCKTHSYSFFKNDGNHEKGVIVQILTNLVAARKETRKKIAENHKRIQLEVEQNSQLSKDPSLSELANALIDQTIKNPLILELLEENNLLDIRQLEYKLAGNSTYGALGASIGYIPLLEVARCVTFKGREWIELIKKDISTVYGGKVIYGDTDSAFAYFDGVLFVNLYKLGKKISEELEPKLPPPMKLEFDKLYKRFLMLTKKRYIAYPCNEKGEYEMVTNKRLGGIKTPKMVAKGVMLVRRECCEFAKIVYEKVVRKLLDSEMVTNKEVKQEYKDNLLKEILILIELEIDKIMRGEYPDELFTITKTLSKSIHEYDTELPQIAAAKLMNSRLEGSAGQHSKVSYIVTTKGGPRAKQSFKVEEYDYFCKHRDVLKIDYMFLIEKQIINSIDQVLNIVFKREDACKNLVKTKISLLNQEIIEFPNIVLVGDIPPVYEKPTKRQKLVLLPSTEGEMEGEIEPIKKQPKKRVKISKKEQLLEETFLHERNTDKELEQRCNELLNL